jgi:EAL domain-containing protein (putative c-di-GMP-specific phosphodiesterase class I)
MDRDDSWEGAGPRQRLLHHDLLELLRDALDGDSFVVCAQPIVDLVTGYAVKHELSLSLPARDGSLVSPHAFLPLAERFGLIAELDHALIRHGAAVAAGGDAVALDVHPGSIADPGLAGRTEQALADAGAPPGLVTFELSEQSLTTNVRAGTAFLERVHKLGCCITGDAFGLGAAGFGYLERLPLDRLKIDACFVEGLQSTPSDDQFVRAFTHLARGLGFGAAADGVMDTVSRDVLRAAGIDQAQGPLFGVPAPLPVSGLATALGARRDRQER